jgi:hypothetical protein
MPRWLSAGERTLALPTEVGLRTSKHHRQGGCGPQVSVLISKSGMRRDGQPMRTRRPSGPHTPTSWRPHSRCRRRRGSAATSPRPPADQKNYKAPSARGDKASLCPEISDVRTWPSQGGPRISAILRDSWRLQGKYRRQNATVAGPRWCEGGRIAAPVGRPLRRPRRDLRRRLRFAQFPVRLSRPQAWLGPTA